MTLMSVPLFRLVCRLILLAVLGNILLLGECAMANGFIEGLLSAKSATRMNCYKITEKLEEQFYSGLMDWIVVEDAEGHRFVVISFSTQRAYEESFDPHILSLEGIQILEDAFATVVSPDGCGIARETWDSFGADTIDNSIDRVKFLFGGRMFGETPPEAAPIDVPARPRRSMVPHWRSKKQHRMSASFRFTITSAAEGAKEPLRRKIKDLFRELRRRARAQRAYWKELDPTPSGRECHLLVVE